MRLVTNGFEEQLDLGNYPAGLSYAAGRINGTALKIEAQYATDHFVAKSFQLAEEAVQSSVHNNGQVGRAYICVDGLPTTVSPYATPDTTVFGFTGANMAFGITNDGYWTVQDTQGRRPSGPSVPQANSILDIPVIPGQYYCLEVGINYVTTGVTPRIFIVYRIDGVTVSCVGYDGGGGTLSGSWIAKCDGSSSSNPATYVDDFALNDFYGSDQNTWPGPGHTVLCLPESVGVTGDWTTGTSYNATIDRGRVTIGSTDECYTGDVIQDIYSEHVGADSDGYNTNKLEAINNVPERNDNNIQGDYYVGGFGYKYAEARMLSNPGSMVDERFQSIGPAIAPPGPDCHVGPYANYYRKEWRQFNDANVGDAITAAQNTSLISGAIAISYARVCCGRGNSTGAPGFESYSDTHTTGNVDVTAFGQTLTFDVGSRFSAGCTFKTVEAYGATPTNIVLTRQTVNKFVLNVSAIWTLVECMAETQASFPTACSETITAGPIVCFV